MMRRILVTWVTFFSIKVFGEQNVSYQDLIVKNQIVQEGNQRCQERYDLIRPILDRYSRPFSVLDIGANLGYFSLKIAEEYDAICTMIEGSDGPEKKKLYWQYQDRLQGVCELNDHINNLYYLKHKITLDSIAELNALEHFDVVLAFLVVHMMAADDKGYINWSHFQQYIEHILNLGDDVILEMSVDVYPGLDEYVQKICIERGGIFLGEMPRSKSLLHKSLGRFYWFQKANRRSAYDAEKVSEQTFEKFNGVHPKVYPK